LIQWRLTVNSFQKKGGMAALMAAAAFVVGFALYFTVLASAGYGSLAVDPMQHVAFLAANQSIMYLWNLIIYVIFGVFLVVLALALHERLKSAAPAMIQTATAFGLIWAGLVIASGMVANIGTAVVVELYGQDAVQAVSVWLALTVMVEGLGGGNEIVGGLWVLLVSLAALRAGELPKALNYLGIVIGVAGLITVVPALGEAGAIFGLGSILWFAWLGIVMLRSGPGVAALSRPPSSFGTENLNSEAAAR
jgi:hypothetical protein